MTGRRVARILGFEIRLDFSWFILFFLILWTFSVGVFPQEAPGLSSPAYLLMGAAGALLFFASVVAHELSHSVVARAKGIVVEGITLFLFGGIAQTRMEATTPRDEFEIAAAGPLMSLAIAAVLGVLAWWLRAFGPASDAAAAVLDTITRLNIALAVFNLLPGFPLDGGRLFRALVWKLTGDATKATRIASTAGRWLAYVLVAFGLLSAFQGNVIGGMWLVLIGWFLRNAAISGYQQHVLLGMLSGIRAAQAMTPAPDVVPAHASVRHLLPALLLRRHHSAYPVVDDERVVGMVTVRALRDVPGEDWDVRTARDIMVPLADVMTVRADDHLVTVLDRLKDSPVGRVLVMRGEELAGIITPRDIAFWLEAQGNPDAAIAHQPLDGDDAEAGAPRKRRRRRRRSHAGE